MTLDYYDESIYEEENIVMKNIWFFILMLIWWWKRGTMGYFTFDKMDVIGASVLLSSWLYRTAYDQFKLKTSKFVSDPIATTTDGEPYNAGDYVVFSHNDINYIFKLKGKKGCSVIPKSSITALGNHYITTAHTVEVTFDQLPRKAQEQIQRNDLKPPFYLGIIDATTMLRKPEVQELELVTRELFSENSKLRETIRRRLKQAEDLAEHESRIKKTLKRKPFGFMRELIGKSDED